MKKIPSQYVKLVDHLRKACKQLHWKFSLETDLVKRWEIEDGIAFTIDGVEYAVTSTDAGGGWGKHHYYALVVVQHHGNREEPPSEDEYVLSGHNTRMPEQLVTRFMDAHWKERRSWVGEALMEEPED